MQTQTLRDAAIEVIRTLPPAASLEEIMYQINMVAQVLEGLKDKQDGKVISSDNLLKETETWQ
jgi:hypothetical protein